MNQCYLLMGFLRMAKRQVGVCVRLVKSVGFMVIAALLFACGAADVKEMAEEPAATMVDTNMFLPKPAVDEATGQALPYVPAENPYLALKGRIDKQAVTKFIQARRLFKAENYTAAEPLLVEIIDIDKTLSGPWVMRGDIALAKDDLALAIEHYEQALKVNGRNLNAFIRLAKAQRVAGEFLTAQNTYAEALALWPDFPEAHLNLGILYDVYLNHPSRAQRHMQAYQLLTDKENPQVAEWLNEIQQRTGVNAQLSTP